MRLARLPGFVCSLLLAVLLGACATPPQTASLRQTQGLPEPVALIADLPFFPQDDYQCGPAALATMLQHAGIERSPEALVPLVYVPGRKGSFQIELTATARQAGLLAYTLDPTLETVLHEVQAGHPVLVLQNLGLSWLPRWHFAVIKGYDLTRGELVLNSGRTEHYRLSLATFERTWARAGHWAQVMLPPTQLPRTAAPQTLFSALAALQAVGRNEAAAEGFEAALQRWPDNGQLLLGAGNLFHSMGQQSRALQAFRLATRVEPASAPAHNNLAQLLLDSGQPAAALPHAERAVALGGEFASIYRATLEDVQQALE